jgi:putative MATE family efflux protein
MPHAIVRRHQTPGNVAPQTRLLLEAPVLPMLLRLSAPNLAEAAARVTFLTVDAVFVSWLGTDALAAVAIVFPLMLMFQSVTSAGFGAGVSASIGRALGAGDADRARRLAGTAPALAVVASLATSVFFLACGARLYRAMGAAGSTLLMAGTYGAVVFGGIGFLWVMNILANVSRGAGNMGMAALGIAFGEIAHLLLSPVLILGWGPFPPLGIVGAAIGILAAYATGAAVIGVHLLSRHALVRIELQHIRIRAAEARAILEIGMPAAATVLVFWSTSVVTTALVGQLGSVPLAAYGIATRLDTVQYPLVFACGSSVVAMVATAMGPGDRARAAQVARTGCAVAAAIASPFATIAVFGRAWTRIFASDPDVIGLGALYLHSQAVVFPVFAAGIAATWACTAAGMVRPPLIVGVMRFVVAGGGGWMLLTFVGGARPVFLAVALAGSIYGLGMLLILRIGFARLARLSP